MGDISLNNGRLNGSSLNVPKNHGAATPVKQHLVPIAVYQESCN